MLIDILLLASDTKIVLEKLLLSVHCCTVFITYCHVTMTDKKLYFTHTSFFNIRSHYVSVIFTEWMCVNSKNATAHLRSVPPLTLEVTSACHLRFNKVKPLTAYAWKIFTLSIVKPREHAIPDVYQDYLPINISRVSDFVNRLQGSAQAGNLGSGEGCWSLDIVHVN